MPRPIYIVCGAKGGVGKTTTAITLVDALRAVGIKVAVVDADPCNPGAYKMHRSPEGTPLACDAVEAIDLGRTEGWCALVNLSDELRDHAIVIDTPAGNFGAMKHHAATLYGALDELGREILHVFVCSGRRDSVELLRQYCELVPEGQTVHVVCNEMFGRRDEGAFDLFLDTQLYRRLLEGGSKIVWLPELPGRVMTEIDWHRQSIAEAARKLPLGQRTVLRTWIESFRRVLGPLQDAA
ncbi:MAG: hypothetical protein RL385_154 [Pseudomonadota bacterium]|jgi:hypothetical protein